MEDHEDYFEIPFGSDDGADYAHVAGMGICFSSLEQHFMRVRQRNLVALWGRVRCAGRIIAGRTIGWFFGLGISPLDGNAAFYLWLLLLGAAGLELFVVWVISWLR